MSKFMHLQMSCSFKLLAIFIDLTFPVDPDNSVQSCGLNGLNIF